jgi:Icc-related predicted phosphoesterase
VEHQRLTGPTGVLYPMLVLGDAHANDPERRRGLLSAYEASPSSTAIQLGDLMYYDLPKPTWFIAGNNEDLDVIEALRNGRDPPTVRNANLLHSTSVDLEGVRFAGLSGNYAPTQYQKDRQHLQGDRRRHFVRNDVRGAKRLSDVDVLLTHEAPNGLLQYEHYDPGCDQVDDLLDALDPDLCLVGHHHEHLEMTYGSTRVVGLDAAWRSYYELDTDDLTLERHETPDG